MVQRVERFRDAIEFDALGQSEGAAETGIQTEEVEAYPRVAPDHCARKSFGAGIQPAVCGQAESRSARSLGGACFVFAPVVMLKGSGE
jgi:hypothetical protein